MHCALTMIAAVVLTFGFNTTFSEEFAFEIDDETSALAIEFAPKLDNDPGQWLRPIHGSQCDAVYKAVSATGNARIGSQRVSRWRLIFGRELCEDLAGVRMICELAALSCELPHEPGLIDAIAGLRYSLDDHLLLTSIEESLLGTVTGYAFELEESPALVDRVKLLGRLPWLVGVTVRLRDPDHPSPELMAALRELRVLNVSLCDLNGVDREYERFLQALADGKFGFKSASRD